MAEIVDVLAYLWMQYPEEERGDLSRSRLMGMAYLADWRYVLQHGEQLTSATWSLGKWGPFSKEVYDVLEDPKPPFRIVDEENAYGTPKGRVELPEAVDTPSIGNSERIVLHHVVEAAKDLRWTEFVGLVYSTYPIVSAGERFEPMDLPTLATSYREAEPLLHGPEVGSSEHGS